jgi:hypothetical protein
VPCPLCGGLIHPIAGKCKHCKADLSSYRSARPAANAPLPALTQAPAPVNGVPAHAPIAHAVPVPAMAHDAAQPVLPPRPTARVQAPQPAGSAWRSWPVVVIVVATMAIIAAVVLMMWPARSHGGKRALQPPPAPERMDTQTPPVMPKIDSPVTPQPAPQGSAQDPWSMRPADPQDPSATLDPGSAGPGSAGGADPDEPDLDALDPGASPPSPRVPAARRHGAAGNLAGPMASVMAHLCRKLVQCGADDAQMMSACNLMLRMPDTPPISCPAAQRCLGHIDAMSCAGRADASQMTQRLMRFTDCIDATHC